MKLKWVDTVIVSGIQSGEFCVVFGHSGCMMIVFLPTLHPIGISHVVFPAIFTCILFTMLVFCHLRFPFGTDAACVHWLWQCCLLLYFAHFLMTLSHIRLTLLSQTCNLSSFKTALRGETNTPNNTSPSNNGSQLS